MILVLDTSAVIAGFIPGLAKVDQVTVSEVMEEARDLCSRLELETAIIAGNLRVMEPSRESVRAVMEKIKETGDIVSPTDLKLIALAMDLKDRGAELVTDDYAIQNLATMFGIPYRRIAMPGIKEVLRWEFVCTGCGRRYPVDARSCPECGSGLVRRAKR
ncbi:MAG: ribonuclease VapC [Candidatus Hadarchaeales archaeon]